MVFIFDELGEHIHLGHVAAHIELALVMSGTYHIGLKLKDGPTRVAHGRTVKVDPDAEEERKRRRDADRAAGMPVGKYASYSDLVDNLGEGNLAALSRGEPPQTATEKAQNERRGKLIQQSHEKLVEELTQIRKRFYPDFDIADFRDGPHTYVSEIRQCVDRIFPPPSVQSLIELARKGRRKLSLVTRFASTADRIEITNYLRAIAWFVDRFDFIDAPTIADIKDLTVRSAREYLQAIQAYLERVPQRNLAYETVLTEYTNGNERVAAKAGAKLARTVQPVHFEDFSGHQFERLVFAYHLRTEQWRTLEWYGQSGSDLGRDIWGERATGESLCIQCVNRKATTATKITGDLDKIVCARGGVPDAVLVVCASSISAKLRDKVKEHAQKKGIAHCGIWSGNEFEERLRRDAECLLKRFVDGESFPDDPGELRRFADSKSVSDDAVVERIIRVFDRPAFHTPFRQESSLPAFRQAIGDTIQALNTGIWQTRDGKEIERLPSRHQLANEGLRNEFGLVVRDLTELRAQFEQLVRDGEIRPCGCDKPDCPVFFFSPMAAHRMDALRAAILSRVHALRRTEKARIKPKT